MTTQPSISAQNPVLQAELRHQWYVLENSRSGRLWIVMALIMLLPALLTSLVMVVGVMVNAPFASTPLFQPSSVTLDPAVRTLLNIGITTLLVMNIALYTVVLLISFGLASNSILREKRGKTWDSLLLTNISASKLVYGKFAASLYALWGDHLMVGLLRLGLVAWVVASLHNFIPEPQVPFQLHVIILILFSVIFSVLDVLLTTALGLFATLLNVPASVGASVFGGLRLVLLFYALGLIYLIFKTLFEVPGWQYVSTGLIGLALYGVMAFGILRLAQVAAVVGSMASPGGE